jgi:hypothetical protein
MNTGLVAMGKGAAEGVDKLAGTVMGSEVKEETAQAFDTIARWDQSNTVFELVILESL